MLSYAHISTIATQKIGEVAGARDLDASMRSLVRTAGFEPARGLPPSGF